MSVVTGVVTTSPNSGVRGRRYRPSQKFGWEFCQSFQKNGGAVERWISAATAWISLRRCCCAAVELLLCCAGKQIDKLHARTLELELELQREQRPRDSGKEQRAIED